MLTNVVKVVSGDTPQTLERVAAMYETIVEPGVHRAPASRQRKRAR
jgi:UDP-N-acetyl-D-galactosamine dehydrogenase